MFCQMEVEIFLASLVLLWQRNWLKTRLKDILSCDDRETITSFSLQTLSFLLSRLYSAVRMCSVYLYTMLYYTIHCQPRVLSENVTVSQFAILSPFSYGNKIILVH